MRRAGTGRTGRGFSLLEVMLATVLGGLLLVSCLALLRVMQVADERAARRAELANQLELTHRTLGNAFRTLIMSPMPVPEYDEDEGEEPELPSGEVYRFDLGPNLRERARLSDGEGSFASQRLVMTLRGPAVFVPPERTQGDGFWDRARARREASEQERALEIERELLAEFAERGGSDRGPRLAPGVRVVFELLPDEEPASGERSYSLWYRELPGVDLVDVLGGLDEDLSEELRGFDGGEGSLDLGDSEEEGARQLLVSGLRYARWQVFKRREFRDELRAAWIRQLPAYVTLELQTVGGHWEKWLFEVSLARGALPGSIVEAAEDDLRATEEQGVLPEGVDLPLEGEP